MWMLLARAFNIHCTTKQDKALAIAIIFLLSPMLLGFIALVIAFGFMTAIGVPAIAIGGMAYLPQLYLTEFLPYNSLIGKIIWGWVFLIMFVCLGGIAGFHIYFGLYGFIKSK